MKNLPYLLSLLALIFVIQGFSQTLDVNGKIPVDEKVKIGKLKNGFTYYIRENNRPENRIELRLALNVGSVLENDDQLGLAHFIEHMCFNGTEHFDKNELIEYLQSVGVRFGADLNAYTSFDETVYMLTIPSDSSDLVNKGFLVMEDWAHGVTFEDEEIDKERGVVIEEWRMGRGAMQRIRDKILPDIFGNSKYADRLPIGSKEIIENASYKTIKQFYKDWYRPDLMALVVVGDIDAELAEKKIIEHFSKLKMPKKPRERKNYLIPDNDSTFVTIATDKEMPYTVVQLYKKVDPVKTVFGKDYIHALQYNSITGMLNRRMAELTEKPEPPFMMGAFNYGPLVSESKYTFDGYVVVSENGVEKGMKTLLEEAERARSQGFAQGELDRFKLDLIQNYEKAYIERDKSESESLAGEYVRNFLQEEPIPGIEYEYTLVKENIDAITLEDINKMAAELISSENRIIVLVGPEKDGLILPTEETLLAIAAEVDNSKLEAYQDKMSAAKLIDTLPEAGTIVEEKILEEIDAVELKLSNGARVILKKTEFKNDEVILTGFSQGGTSIYSDEDFQSALNADAIVQESGVGAFSVSDIRKVLAGKSVSVSPDISELTQALSANCRPGDMEDMMQLLYLYFTNPRHDEASFQSYLSKKKDLNQNMAKEPVNYFFDQFSRIKLQGHPRGNYLPTDEDWNKINFQRSIEIYKECFSDASEFTFVMVGAFNLDSAKNLASLYLASLPSTNSKKTFKDLGIRPPNGVVDSAIFKGNDPKSIAILQFHKEIDFNIKDQFLFNQFGQILQRKYTEILREEMSGVYSVRARTNISRDPYGNSSLQILIPTAPESVDSLISAAIREIKSIQMAGVKDEDIAIAKEIYRREKEKNLKENNYWLGAIKNCIVFNQDFEEISSFESMDEITSEQIQRVANDYINTDEYLRVVLYPEESTKNDQD